MPSFRYLVRELIPRAVLLSITFKWIMPFTGLFYFFGGIPAAIGFGVVYTALFLLFGAYIMPSATVQAFLARHAHRWFYPLLNLSVVVLVPLIALVLTALAVPGLFAINWLWGVGPFVGSIILNLACAVTHDYAGGDEHRCPSPVCGEEKEKA